MKHKDFNSTVAAAHERMTQQVTDYDSAMAAATALVRYTSSQTRAAYRSENRDKYDLALTAEAAAEAALRALQVCRVRQTTYKLDGQAPTLKDVVEVLLPEYCRRADQSLSRAVDYVTDRFPDTEFKELDVIHDAVFDRYNSLSERMIQYYMALSS